MIVYFLRHGESEANASDQVSGYSVELTEKGREQAYAAAGLLVNKDISTILVSPLLRAEQTAQIIADEIDGAEMLVMGELAERDLGKYKGQSRPDNKNFFYEIDDSNGVETRQELTARAASALDKISRAAKEADGKVLIVSHAILGFFLRNLAKGNREYDNFDWSLKIKNAEIVEMEFVKNEGVV